MPWGWSIVRGSASHHSASRSDPCSSVTETASRMRSHWKRVEMAPKEGTKSQSRRAYALSGGFTPQYCPGVVAFEHLRANRLPTGSPGCRLVIPLKRQICEGRAPRIIARCRRVSGPLPTSSTSSLPAHDSDSTISPPM